MSAHSFCWKTNLAFNKKYFYWIFRGELQSWHASGYACMKGKESSWPHLMTSFKLKYGLWFLPLLLLFLFKLRFFWCICRVLHCPGWPLWSNDCQLTLSAHFVCSLVVNICVHTCTQGAYCVRITHRHVCTHIRVHTHTFFCFHPSVINIAT